MALKWKELEHILSEARPVLENSVLQKISQSEAWAFGNSFLLQGFSENAGPWRLWICLQPEDTCACLLPNSLKPDSAKEPSTFVMVLRKHLLGQKIRKVEQLPNERIFLLHFESEHSLIVEVIPKRGNIILLEQWDGSEKRGRCLGSFDQVSLSAGALYKLPPSPESVKADARDFRELPGLRYNERVANFYWDRVGNSEFNAVKRVWRQAVRSQRKKMATAVENTKRDLEQAQEAELFQKRGKALVAKLYELGPKKLPKEKMIELDGLVIPLDKTKTYSDNAEHFFKKSKKFERAVDELQGRTDNLQAKLDKLDEFLEKVETATSEEELENERVAVEKLGVIIGDHREQGKEKKEGQGAKPYLEVSSSDGFSILCGRNQEENRRVTFQEARGNDMWLHVKGMPGAHVVIKCQKNKTIPLSTLLEAAQITLYYSKIRKGKRAEVDYTFRKHVKPIKGTLAEVTYTGNKTLYVEADAEQIKKLMQEGSAL